MLKKLLVLAITSGLAAKMYKAYAAKQADTRAGQTPPSNPSASSAASTQSSPFPTSPGSSEPLM